VFIGTRIIDCCGRRIDDSIVVASLEATAGSVIAKHERISPSSSGLSQRSCCSGAP
jgi:hypothetical protein